MRGIPMIRVFVTDADYKHTLGAVRDLGKSGYKVDVGSSRLRAASFYSKFVEKCFLYTHPFFDEKKFIRELYGIVKTRKYDVLLPIGYYSTIAVARVKGKLEKFTKIPVADWQAVDIASKKDETIRLARKVHVPAPKTIFVDNTGKPEEKVSFKPIVLKGITGAGRVIYLKSTKHLDKEIKKFHNQFGEYPIIQEYIPGEGFGFFALFNKGKPRAIFSHRRIREFPATGGPSTSAMSYYDPKLKEYGLRILRALNWHGVAMVEFRKDYRDGEYKIMEINPKFWGSLDLAIASGVRFPYLACKMSIDGDISPVFTYKVGLRFTWPFPDDAQHVISRPSDILRFIHDILSPRVRKNIMIKDIKPNLIQLVLTLNKIKIAVKKRK